MKTEMMRMLAFLTAVALPVVPAAAQSGTGLEGTTVTLRMDMPASSDGVDVLPSGGGVDFKKLNDSLHRNGVGVHNGEAIMITKVAFKDHHIEVQLGGGGYGTFADRLNEAAQQSAATVPYEGKSRREKDLEAQAKYSDNYWERRDARDELHDTRNERNRDNAQAAAVNAQTQMMVQANARAARANAGSRFNIRYDNGFPDGARTATGIKQALGRYVDFGEGVSASPPIEDSRETRGVALRKGLTVQQVEQMLGPAEGVSQKNEGGLSVSVREYSTDDRQRVSAQFVGGVLVDYTITPRP